VRKEDITAEVVERLVGRQFPQWAGLRVSAVALDGWDNTTFRLGDDMSVRLPSADLYVAQVDKEHRWLPELGPHLPCRIPEPVAKGEPDAGFPRPWSVYRWIDGDTATDATVTDRNDLARDLAAFLAALYACDTSAGPVAGPHSHGRGGPVSVWDDQVRWALQRLDGSVDTGACAEVWRRSRPARSMRRSGCTATSSAPTCWCARDSCTP
jgi:aminoglycoside phosphotransferase (APT) family kinase protein